MPWFCPGCWPLRRSLFRAVARRSLRTIRINAPILPRRRPSAPCSEACLEALQVAFLAAAAWAAKSILWLMPAASYLGDQLLKMLDCKEQQQAATATDKAIRGGVGTEVSWKSEDRPNVSGHLEGHSTAGVGGWRDVPHRHRRRDRRRRRNDGPKEDVQGARRKRLREGVR